MKSFAAWCFCVSTVLASAQKPLDAYQDGEAYVTYQSESSPDHSIRIKRQDDSLCDARSPQYTGWLDVGRKHLFFWYFESRSDPKNDPLALWLTGGPGGSSMIGLMQELGPCIVNDHGNGTVHNPYGWSAAANMLFVDQPAGVGFSYLDEDEPIPDNSFTAAEDMHRFLQIFVGKAFPDKATSDFHITGESYGGHYLPALGAEIVRQNALHPRQQKVNLKSILIGNGLLSAADTTFGIWETLCTTNPGVPEPIFNKTRCDIIASNMARCVHVTKVCNASPDPALCQAAESVCWEGVVKWYDSESVVGGRNRFDITKPCEGNEDMCYQRSIMLEKYLNSKKVWKALEIPPAVKNFTGGSEAVAAAFGLGYDFDLSMQPQMQYLLANEIDILMYQGNVDYACNTAGNVRWANNMPWKGQTEFTARPFVPWKSKAEGGKEKKVGTFKEVEVSMVEGSKKKTKFSFVTIDGSGHLDKPEIALDMFSRWLTGAAFGEKEALRHDDL